MKDGVDEAPPGGYQHPHGGVIVASSGITTSLVPPKGRICLLNLTLQYLAKDYGGRY